MPARHGHHRSSEQRKSFTITLESCSPSAGICVHVGPEYAGKWHRGALPACIATGLAKSYAQKLYKRPEACRLAWEIMANQGLDNNRGTARGEAVPDAIKQSTGEGGASFLAECYKHNASKNA